MIQNYPKNSSGNSRFFSFLFLVTILSFSINLGQLSAQNVSILPGETTTIETAAVYNGDFGPSNTGGSGFSVNFNKGRGILSIGYEVQSDNYASWDIAHIAFWYNGSWKSIAWFNNSDNQTGCDHTASWNTNYYTKNGATVIPWPVCSTGNYGNGNYETLSSDASYTKIGKMGGGFSDRYQNICIKNMGNLNVYHNNYLPQSGVIQNRVAPADNNMWGIQTATYTGTGKPYPAFNDPNPSTKKTTGYDVSNYVQYGNLPGFIYNQYSTQIGVVILNIANLPPDMLEAPSFKVHIYALSNGNNHNRIYETTYNNQNFMTQGPMSLSASQDQCGKVDLSWSNSNNPLPDDGTVTLKNVIFRNGIYLATVAGTQTTYSDITALQDVSYQYTVRHVAFSETGETYYRSPATVSVTGFVKPRPDQPISPTASSNSCNGNIEVNWSFNGTNPQYFRLDDATNAAGPFTTISSTIPGSSRNYNHTGLTRGVTHYYRIYAINSCGVQSNNYAECSGISIADPLLPAAVTATLNATYDTIKVSWTDAANNETKYQIQRQDNLGNLVTYDINPKAGSGTTLSYSDFGVSACKSYTYSVKVFNECVQSGLISSSVQVNNVPPPSLNTTFTATKKLTCSKGYFSNRIELGWLNNNGQNIDLFKIYRKIVGTSLDSTLVGTSAAGSGFYVDNTADARVYYKYTIVGIKYCNGLDILSNTSEDIGFRNPTGVISGHIEYNGGIALNGAKVIIQPSAGATGKSLQFSSGSTMSLQTAATLGLTGDLRMEFWFKPTSYNASQNIVEKAGVFSFKHIGSNYIAMVTVGGTAYTITVSESNFALNNWKHVSIQYSSATAQFKLYANGIVIGSNSVPAGTIASVSNQVVFGGANSAFYLDEFRLLANSTLDTNIYIDHARFLNTNVQGAKISLHLDEGFGDYAYDGSSQSNVYNANHFLKTAGVSWSNDIPSSGQLSYFGITDSLGNYNVSGILFSGTGENFSIIPYYLTHSFSPNSRAVYIGDNSTVFNNQDFIDNSSFPFSGLITYKNTTCPVPGASVKIDGLPVVVNGQAVVTATDGTFNISVPIGNHFVSLEKYGHYMEIGTFPATGTYNFQGPLANVQFVDSTKRSIVGRLVGGLVEAEKAPGMGRSKNNLGVAKIRIVSPIAGVPCFSAEVLTDIISGEYRFEVPPLEYRIDSAYVVSNRYVLTSSLSPSPFTNTNQPIDLRNTVNVTTSIDSVFNTSGTWSGVVDSSKFHIRRDFVYRITPTINVTRADNTVFIGEDSLRFGTSTFSIRPVGAQQWGLFNWPVFKQGKSYTAKFHGVEIYKNFDDNSMDTVLLNGNVHVTNNLISGQDPTPLVAMSNGTATYTFTCGEPNNATHALNPSLSYTKDLQVIFEPQGAPSVSWLPNNVLTPGFENYHAYVIGQKITGTGVSTQGPDRVDFILRDPPGSGSNAVWGTGTTVTKSTSMSKGVNEESETTVSLLLGKKALTGAIAYYEEIEVDNTVGLGFSNTYAKTKENTYTETMTTFSTVSTRDDADNVGAPADIFIGRAQNWLVGPTSNIELMDTARCSTGIQCFGPVINGLRMAKTVGYAVAPNGVRTRFSYTQEEIETIVIPTLESIRNTFLQTNPAYTSHLPASSPLYAINNDDPLIPAANRSSLTENVYEPQDTTGISYTFMGIITNTDSVRVINTQISLWKRALAKNEKEKYQCVSNTGGTLIDNFTLGSAIVNNTYSIDNETTSTETYELALGGNTKAELGAAIGGIGFKTDISLTVMATSGESSSNGVTQSSSFEYTLTDGDPGDVMSIDVYKSPEGTGNVFVTRGGQTMCPYEDEVKFKYFNPSQPTAYIGSHTNIANGFVLSNATVKREDPNIVITPTFQANIPSGQAAVYQLLLTNQSALTVNNDIDLRIYVASQSNPHGAVIKIDGLNPNTAYTIPTGASVIKTLTIERGPIEINYDSLMIIFASVCSDDIADTAYVTAHFIPTCTDLNITAPTNNWVFNNSINNTANLIVSDYNYNYGAATDNSTNPPTLLGLNKIGLEFKPNNSSTWVEFESFYKYPGPGQDTISTSQIYSQYLWDISTLPDGGYEIKSKSHCLNNDGSFSTVESPVLTGVIDRINPHPFGTPSPADGILDPNDDIMIQFNEPVDLGALSNLNFDVRGVINGGDIRHFESLGFDGINDYAEVSGGADIQKRDFTFEFWAKATTTGIDQTIISQGTDINQYFSIGFNASDKLIFNFSGQSVSSNSAIGTLTDWHHYAVAYSFSNQVASLYVDGALVNSGNTNLFFDYTGTGKIVFGKQIPSNTNFFNGKLHEVRLWTTTRTNGEIVQNFNKDLNRTTASLLYNWKMDEVTGNVTKDVIRSRNADIYGASWAIEPGGSAASFDGVDDRVDVVASTIPVTKEMDFTLEFWFNSTQTSAATLFSNGKGDGLGADSLYSWNIQKDASGLIHVYHRGIDFVATNTNYFDGNWHHFALVLKRNSNLSSYIDGSLINTTQASAFDQMGGPDIYIGARGYYTGAVPNYDNHFNGWIDEFRLWNTSRTLEQVIRDSHNRMLGNEFGLQAYIPFETYSVNGSGVPILGASFNDNSVNTLTSTAQNGPSLISTTPNIKIPRPVQSVGFNYSVNNDKIIITPTIAPYYIEDVTLDITVKNVYDMHQNQLQSPKTWIAYVNKNQVKWQDVSLAFQKNNPDSVIVFTTQIVNTGGAAKPYTIGGLPSWLSADILSGTIAPNSNQTITFTIPAGSMVGDFSASLTLTTDFGYNEILTVDLKVRGTEPDWSFDPSAFQYSMNVIGQLKVDGVIVANTENKIAAFTNGVLCGSATLQYISAQDKYVVFLTIYNNNITGDSIRFNIYDAASGLTFVNVIPSIMFEDGDIMGSVSNPVTFIANSEVQLNIPLSSGWTWISLPLKSNQLQHSNLLMAGMNNVDNDVIRSISAYDQFNTGYGWLGNISSSTERFQNSDSYKIMRDSAETLVLNGLRINPDSAIALIDVLPGWNWIGYVSTKNMDINTALGNYNAINGDVVKSQFKFAVYDNASGWIGSLTTMNPGYGYMLKSTGSSNFNYPLSLYYGKNTNSGLENYQVNTNISYPFKPESYESNMSVIASSNLCASVAGDSTVALGAFDVNNVLRGYAHAKLNEKSNSYLYYLTIHSNTDGEKYDLKFFNTQSGNLINSSTQITFVNEKIEGSLSLPYVVVLADSVACPTTLPANVTSIADSGNELEGIIVTPNPFNGSINLLIQNIFNGKVELIDVLGRIITSAMINGENKITLDLGAKNISNGVYYIRISGDVTKIIKVVKTNE